MYIFIERSLRKLNIRESNLAFFVELPQSISIKSYLLKIKVFVLFEWVSRKHFTIDLFNMVFLFEHFGHFGGQFKDYLRYVPTFVPDESFSFLELEGLLHYNLGFEVANICFVRHQFYLCLQGLIYSLMVVFLRESLNYQITLNPFPFFIDHILHALTILFLNYYNLILFSFILYFIKLYLPIYSNSNVNH